MPSDLEGKVSDKDGNVMSLNSIKTTHLPKLVETGYVIHEEGAGYQSAEFNKLMPKFE